MDIKPFFLQQNIDKTAGVFQGRQVLIRLDGKLARLHGPIGSTDRVTRFPSNDILSPDELRPSLVRKDRELCRAGQIFLRSGTDTVRRERGAEKLRGSPHGQSPLSNGPGQKAHHTSWDRSLP